MSGSSFLIIYMSEESEIIGKGLTRQCTYFIHVPRIFLKQLCNGHSDLRFYSLCWSGIGSE